MTDINKEYEKEYYDEYRNNYYNPDDDDAEPGINLNWKRIQKGFHSVAAGDQETAETLSGMQANLETLNTDVETLKTDVDEIKESVDDLNIAVVTAEQAAAAAAASEAAAQAAQAAIKEIEESIPEDYTELSDDVSELKSAFGNLDKAYTSTLPFDLTSGEYVERGTGVFKTYGGWSRTGYIDLADVVDFTPNKGSNYSAFYDDSKTYVKDVNFTANQKIDVPDGASYLCISNPTNDMNGLLIACTKNGFIKEIQNQVDDINELINSDTYIYPETIVTDAYIYTDGYLVTNASGYLATPYIPLPFNETQSFQIRGVVYGNACCAIYNEDYELLLVISESNREQYGGIVSSDLQTLTIPYINGMKYARLSARTVGYSELTDLWCKGNTLAGAFERITSIETDLHSMAGNISTTIASSKVLVIGDSISTDTYGNYKKWVTDLKESGFLPSDVVNSSQHATGFVARYNNEANDFITRLKAVQNPSQYDLVIVFGGINDYIQNIPMGSDSGTDYTVSFKPAVNEFFSYLIQNFTRARLCVLLPLRTYATWQNTAGEYQQAYGDYIKTVAKSYCLPVLNLTEDSGFCPYITSFRNMWTLVPAGYDASDGVHPNAEYESKYLAPMIKHFLQGLM